LKTVIKGGRAALLCVLFALLITGCAGRGGVTNAGWSVLAVADAVVYAVTPTGTVLALEGDRNGTVIWQYPVSTGASSSPIGCSIAQTASDENAQSALDAVYGLPALTEVLVLIPSHDGRLYAFNRETGELVWDYVAADALIGAATVADGVAYFGSSDGSVYALDVATQELAWPEAFVTGGRVWGAPVVDEDNLYVGSMDHLIYAIDRETGAEVWRYDIGSSVPGNVTLADGTLYVGAIDQRLHALQAADGALLWQTEELGGWVWGEALVVDGAVYFGSLDGQVHGYSVANGTPLWSPITVEGALRAGPVLLNSTSLLVATDAGKIYIVDMAEGTASPFYTLASGKTAEQVLSSPAVEGNMVYVTTTLGNIYGLDASRRDPLVWMYPPSAS
jgi:outer membrane protein assembly factor BamB